MTGLGSFPFARHYLGNHCYFLFLRLLRCFSSAGLLITCGWSSTSRVSPFGNPRIDSHLPIPAAYRSLSRPSSPPRAKASPVYSFLLSSTRAPFAPHGMLFLICCQLFVPWGTPSQQRLYCCLLFLLTSSNMSKNFRSRVRFRTYYKRTFCLEVPVMVENNGVEPLTSCVQGRRSSQLS